MRKLGDDDDDDELSVLVGMSVDIMGTGERWVMFGEADGVVNGFAAISESLWSDITVRFLLWRRYVADDVSGPVTSVHAKRACVKYDNLWLDSR